MCNQAVAADRREERLVWVSSRPRDRRGQLHGRRVGMCWDFAATKAFHADLDDGVLDATPFDSILGSVVLRPRARYDHTLLMSRLDRKVLKYWKGVCSGDEQGHCFVLDVVHSHEFAAAQPWTAMRYSNRCNPVCFHILEQRNFERLLPHLRNDLRGIEHEPVLAVRLPRAIAKLLVSGMLSSLVLPDFQLMKFGFDRALVGYWKLRDFPPHAFHVGGPGGHFDLAMTQDLADSLRLALHHIDNPPQGLLQHANRDRLRRELPVWTNRLENFTSSTNSDMFARAGTQDRMRHLIRCLFLAEDLVADGSLKAVLTQAVCILLNPEAAAELIASVAQAHIPDKSELSRARLTIDVAHCLHWRSRNTAHMEEGSVRYVLIDSSPQFHRDYELVLTKSIRVEHLVSLWKLSTSMLGRWAGDACLAEQVLDEDRRAAERAEMDEICSKVVACIARRRDRLWSSFCGSQAPCCDALPAA